MAENGEMNLIEEKPKETISSGNVVANSKVYIRAGEYKRKYAVAEKEGKKNKHIQ